MKKRNILTGQASLSVCLALTGLAAVGASYPTTTGSKASGTLKQSTRRSTDPPVPARGKLGQELFIAIGMRDTKAVDSLLKQGADPNARNGLEFTPLYMAAASHQTDVMRTLIGAGANPEAATTYGTPLLFAASTGNVDGFKLLLSHGADINIARTDGLTSLMLATLAGSQDIVSELIERKAKISAQDNTGATALELASRTGRGGIAEVLIGAGANVNDADDLGRTPLMEAAINGHTDTVQLLISKGAKVDARDQSGRTALLLAASYGDYPDVIRTLSKAGASTSLKDAEGRTALDLATSRGYVGAISALGGFGSAPLSARSPHDAALKSLKAIQASMISFGQKTNCVSCHHEGLGKITLGEAKAKGFAIDPKIKSVVDPRLNGMLMGMKPLHEQVLKDPAATLQLPLVEMNEVSTTDAWLLAGMAAEKVPTSEAISSMAMVLGRQQAPDGSWTFAVPRAPMQSSFFTFTALSVRSLDAYALQGNTPEVTERIAKAKTWLLSAKAQNSEDRASRLLGLKWAGANQAEMEPSIAEILADQRADGGWSQLPGLQSDAYATGQALYALHAGGGLSSNAPEYQRGLQFLLRTQDSDGTWYVNKGCMPNNNYLDGGFAHGESQHASFNGSCWATLALLQALNK